MRSRKAAENKPGAPPQDVQSSMDQGVEGVHANPVCVPRIHFAATTSGTMCARTCASRIVGDAIKARVLPRVVPMEEGDVPLPIAPAATGANAKTVCAHLTPTAVKPLGMLPACRNAQTNAEGAVEEQHQLVEMMVAQRAKRRGAAGVRVSSAFARSTPFAAKIRGMSCVSNSAEATAEGAAKVAEAAPPTDALLRKSPVVWIASARPVSVSRIRFVATIHGTKCV